MASSVLTQVTRAEEKTLLRTGRSLSLTDFDKIQAEEEQARHERDKHIDLEAQHDTKQPSTAPLVAGAAQQRKSPQTSSLAAGSTSSSSSSSSSSCWSSCFASCFSSESTQVGDSTRSSAASGSASTQAGGAEEISLKQLAHSRNALAEASASTAGLSAASSSSSAASKSSLASSSSSARKPLPTNASSSASGGRKKRSTTGTIPDLAKRRGGSPVDHSLPDSAQVTKNYNNTGSLLPLASHKGTKPTLVLDLDETLVHSSLRYLANADYVIPVQIERESHRIYVSKRPHVDTFLKQLASDYELVVFTASLSKYAEPVVDLLDKYQVVEGRLFRPACCYHNNSYIKDLARLGRDLSRTLIIDNSPNSYAFHPENAIAITSWFDDTSDTALLDLLPLLHSIADVPDVRTALASL